MPAWIASRPLLVGLTVPPDSPVDARPIDGLSAARLLSFAGLTIPGWLRPTEATTGDVLEAHVDTAVLWPEYAAVRPIAETRERAKAIVYTGRVVLLLGREVQGGFRDRVEDPTSPFYQWMNGAEGDDASMYCVLPAPSGRNRLYARREYRATTGRVLRRAMEAA